MRRISPCSPQVPFGITLLLAAALVVGCHEVPVGPDTGDPVATEAVAASMKCDNPPCGGGGDGGNSATADAGFNGFLTTTDDFAGMKIFKDDARRFEIGEGQAAEIVASLNVVIGEEKGDACWFKGPGDQEAQDNLEAVLDGTKPFTASLWMRYAPRKNGQSSDSHNLALNGASTADGFAFAGGTTFHSSLYPRGDLAPTATWLDKDDGDDSVRTYRYEGYFRVWTTTDTGERVWLFCKTMGDDYIDVTVTIH